MADTHEEQVSRQNIRHTGTGCCFFEIRVRGHLSSEWSDWFENLDIHLLENGETLLSGPIADQAALMGILTRLNRLNLTLLSLNEVNLNAKAKGERNGSTTNTEPEA